MKKIIIALAGIMFSAFVFAQTPATAPKKAATPAKKEAAPATSSYHCSECLYFQEKPGTCPKHPSFPLIKQNAYYCSMDHVASLKAGKCSKCGMDMKKMDRVDAPEKKSEATPAQK